MEIIEIEENEIKSSTIFLLKKKIILHPHISPKGEPDFTNYFGRKYVLLLDRNILTKLIELCRVGHIGDMYIMKLIGSLMFWAVANNIAVTSGLALNEYANHKNNNIDANKENDLFKNIFDFYNPKLWLELALEKRKDIPAIYSNNQLAKFDFNKKNDHFKMHYAEMLHAMSLYIQNNLSIEEKIIQFLQWNDENLLFCQYTIVYILLFFSNKTKKDKALPNPSFENLVNKSSNQAWDLTYLSVWSTFYWHENETNTSYLFSTMDKELKRIFICTHDTMKNIFNFCLGNIRGAKVQKIYEEIINNRIKPTMSAEGIDNLVTNEEHNLKIILNKL